MYSYRKAASIHNRLRFPNYFTFPFITCQLLRVNYYVSFIMCQYVQIQVEKVIEGKYSPHIGIVMENPSTVRLPYFPSAAIVIYKDCISANKKVVSKK